MAVGDVELPPDVDDVGVGEVDAAGLADAGGRAEDLGVAGGVAEPVECELAQDVALLHRVLLVLRSALGRGGPAFGHDLGGCDLLVAGVGGLGECPLDVDEERQRGCHQSPCGALWDGQAREGGCLDPAQSGDEFSQQGESHHGPGDPTDRLEKGEEQGSVVGSRQGLPHAVVGEFDVGQPDRPGGDQHDGHADQQDHQQEGGGESGHDAAHYRSVPFWARTRRADELPVTVNGPSPKLPRNTGR